MVAEGRARDRRQPQQATERAREVRADERGQAQRRHRHVGTGAELVAQPLDVGEEVAERGRRIGNDGFVGAGRGPAPAAVHLDPGADDDALEVGHLGEGVEQGDGAGAGPLDGRGRARPGERLVHPQVHHHRGGEPRHQVVGALAVAGVDAVELGPCQPPAGRIDVEAEHGLDLVVTLQQVGDPGPELATHPGDQHAHVVILPPRRARRSIPGDEPARRGRARAGGSGVLLVDEAQSVQREPRLGVLHSLRQRGDEVGEAPGADDRALAQLVLDPVAQPVDLGGEPVDRA